MNRFVATLMLQDVENEEIYHELDKAVVNEDGYPYLTGPDEKVYALPPDMYEFETEASAKEMMGVLTLICAQIEKKHGLKKTPIVLSEVSELAFANLEELHDDDFQPLN